MMRTTKKRHFCWKSKRNSQKTKKEVWNLEDRKNLRNQPNRNEICSRIDQVVNLSRGSLKMSEKQKNWNLNFQSLIYWNNKNGKNWNSKPSKDLMRQRARVQKASSTSESLCTKWHFMNKPAKHSRKAANWMPPTLSCSTTSAWHFSKMKNTTSLSSILKYALNWTRSIHMHTIIWRSYIICISIRTRPSSCVIRPKSIYQKAPIITAIGIGLSHSTKKVIWPKQSRK